MELMSRLFTQSPDRLPIYDRIPLSFKVGEKSYRGLPASFDRSYTRERVDANITRYTYIGKCGCGLTVRVIHLEYRDYPVSEWYAEFSNNGEAETAVISDITLGGTIAGDFRDFVHGNGDTCGEDGYEWFTDTLIDGGRTIHPYDATSCRGAFPYMKLEFEGFTVRAAVGWPQMWKAFVCRTDGGVHFECGQLRCSMKLMPGETIITPRLTLMAALNTDGGVHSTNLWRRWYLSHVLPRENGHPIKPNLCLHYWNCEDKPEHTAATEENQVGAIETYVRRGMTPDIWWVDAGWYKCDYNWPHTGTWKPDAERFPNGLGPIGEACDKYGIKFLLWFEPERVVPGTELHDEHHDWLFPTEDESDGVHRGNHLLDLGNPEACDWLIERVDSLIKTSHIRVYRQDFNFDPKGIWEREEAADRIGAIENHHVQGYLRYWDELIYRNPGLWIDSCASGGRRNDLETMRRAVPLHYTDVGYGNLPVKQKQFYEMHEWIPYFRSHNMTWDGDLCREGVYKPNDEFSFYNAMVPAMTSMIRFDASDEEFETGNRMYKIWRHAADIILAGDYYPLTECRKDYHDWYAVQFDDSDNERGFVQFIRNTLAPDGEYTVKLHTIPGAVYTFESSRTGGVFTRTAEELEMNGLTLALPERSSDVLFYTIRK